MTLSFSDYVNENLIHEANKQKESQVLKVSKEVKGVMAIKDGRKKIGEISNKEYFFGVYGDKFAYDNNSKNRYDWQYSLELDRWSGQKKTLEECLEYIERYYLKTRGVYKEVVLM